MSTVWNTNFLMNCGEAMALKTPPLSASADAATTSVLQQIARYRLAVFASLRTEAALVDAGPRTIKYVLRDAQQRGWITSAKLHHQARYWRLTAAGAAEIGVALPRSEPLSEPAKLRAYALLAFCRLSDRPRVRLTAEELARYFPDLVRAGLPTGYYLAPQGQSCLGLARVDAGQRGRWDRIVESLREDIESHWQQSGFRTLISAGRFELTVLTVFPQKARRIQEALAAHRDAQRIRVHAVALPQLLPLLTSISERK